MGCEEFADVADSLAQVVDCSRSNFPKMCLEFGKGHFYGIEVWAVRWQEEQPSTSGTKDGLGFLAFVGWKVVEYNDVARGKLRCQLGFDIGVEDDAVHRGVDNERGNKSV